MIFMCFTTICVIEQDSRYCQKDVTNFMRIYLDQLCQLLNNFSSYYIAMPTPEDKSSKKRKNSALELAQHEPAQKRKPPDDKISAFLKNVPLETLTLRAEQKFNRNYLRRLLQTRKNLVNMRRSCPMTNGKVDWFQSCSKF